MEWTGLNELREKFLSFFETKGHMRLPSFPLVPENDNTLLLINAGMAPMKNYFLGVQAPPAKRVATCQKCIRTPDIERVGKTARHGTFFEMLGNFSFGDYFKREAIAWGWEFVTKVLEMPADRLWVSIYEEDDEAFDIWTKEIGVAPERVVRLGKEDNFWEHGSLPCGPCSEIIYDRGEQYGCGKATCGVGCDCDRYMEFWNIVFQQFASDGKGHYERLKKPNIDTGLGLDRIACILQGVDSLFEVDTVQNIMRHVCRIAGVRYKEDEKRDVSLRVITDHIRSTVFMVGDGILPSNEGRGYVLRRLLRRAARHGRLLGIEGGFLAEVADTVIDENASAYPELIEKRDYIKRVIQMEEERFSATVGQGLQLLNADIDRLEASGNGQLSGEEAFRLYDTFGFPLELTGEILAERGLSVDEDGFHALMQAQRERARAARASGDQAAWAGSGDEDTPQTIFEGYERLESKAVIAAIIGDGERRDFASEGDHITVVLDRTPFYAESGGQVGDSGVLRSASAVVQITDCKKSPAGRHLHIGQVISGRVNVGDAVSAEVDGARRRAVMRNHSAAHLLQAALRRVLGSHVRQAGQMVNEKLVRFDFTHFAALTSEELDAVERQVNDSILAGERVVALEMGIEEAKATGAIALFGEKYGDVVRVVQMGGYSSEFCGGTHVDNTAKIGLFHIVSETSVAAGVRRIEAVTGMNLLERARGQEAILQQTAAVLKASPDDCAAKASLIVSELHAKNRKIEALQAGMAAAQLDAVRAGAKTVNGFRVLTAVVKDVDAQTLRLMTDRFKQAESGAVIVLACVTDGRINFAAACGEEAVRRGAHAGNIVKNAAKIAGGGGGGRPDSATAGGRDTSRLNEALASVEKSVLSL